MCFSATVSFAASSVLLPAGVYAIVKAAKRCKRYLWLACVPVFFAIQQAVEGIIWVYFGKGMPASAKTWSYVYLFFVYGCWPFVASMCVYTVETNKRRRKLFYGFVLAAALFDTAVYSAIATGFMPFDISVVGHSISYTYHTPAWVRWMNYTFYVVLGVLPPLLSTVMRVKLYGIMVFWALVVSSVWYVYALTSIWCFFAAVIAIYIALIVKNLDDQSCG